MRRWIGVVMVAVFLGQACSLVTKVRTATTTQDEPNVEETLDRMNQMSFHIAFSHYNHAGGDDLWHQCRTFFNARNHFSLEDLAYERRNVQFTYDQGRLRIPHRVVVSERHRPEKGLLHIEASTQLWEVDLAQLTFMPLPELVNKELPLYRVRFTCENQKVCVNKYGGGVVRVYMGNQALREQTYLTELMMSSYFDQSLTANHKTVIGEFSGPRLAEFSPIIRLNRPVRIGDDVNTGSIGYLTGGANQGFLLYFHDHAEADQFRQAVNHLIRLSAGPDKWMFVIP